MRALFGVATEFGHAVWLGWLRAAFSSFLRSRRRTIGPFRCVCLFVMQLNLTASVHAPSVPLQLRPSALQTRTLPKIASPSPALRSFFPIAPSANEVSSLPTVQILLPAFDSLQRYGSRYPSPGRRRSRSYSGRHSSRSMYRSPSPSRVPHLGSIAAATPAPSRAAPLAPRPWSLLLLLSQPRRFRLFFWPSMPDPAAPTFLLRPHQTPGMMSQPKPGDSPAVRYEDRG